MRDSMRTFYVLLAIALVVVTANNLVWFALIFWAYLATKSVITTSTLAGVYLVMMMASGVWFGSLVDHHKKKHAMLGSSLVTLLLFLAGLAMLQFLPASSFSTVSSVPLWILSVILLAGTITGSIYNIAIPTLVAFVVPEDRRDRANGLFASVTGTAFGITSVASGLVLAYGGMKVVLLTSITATVVVLITLAMLPLAEGAAVHTEEEPRKKEIDLRGTVHAVHAVPGLFALIFFTTFNNFIGGIFFALMDAYGLSMVSVQTWGTLWGIVSLGMILGGLYISRRGLGANPVATLFRVNLILWTVSIFFTIQPSIVLLGIGVFVWLFLVPFVEASEQTIFQKVVPPERLGRVFGFAHSIEQSASPTTAFFTGPVAQWVFIPFMTTGRGVELIGGWFGTGTARGIALFFTVAGCIGVIATLIARRSKAARMLSERYLA